jgi:hypothetical protein
MSISLASAPATGQISSLSIIPTGTISVASHSLGTAVSAVNHPLGQISNQWLGAEINDLVHYRFRLTPSIGTTVALSEVRLNLSELFGVFTANIVSPRLYYDTNSDGIPEDMLDNYGGSASISGSSGNIVFPLSPSYSLSEASDFLVLFSVLNLQSQTDPPLSMQGNISISGNVNFQVGARAGAVSTYQMTLDVSQLESDTCDITAEVTATSATHSR